MNRHGNEDNSPASSQAGKLSSRSLVLLTLQIVGLTLFIGGFFTLLGVWFDLRFGTRPWITLISALAGLPMTLLMVFLFARSRLRKMQRSNNEQPKQQPSDFEGEV